MLGPITKFITLHFKLPFQRRGFLKTIPFVVNSTFKQLSQLTAIFCNNFYFLHFPSFSFLNSQQKSQYTVVNCAGYPCFFFSVQFRAQINIHVTMLFCSTIKEYASYAQENHKSDRNSRRTISETPILHAVGGN
jgi:hypothetical protein